ncbi:hypothetical protein WA026_023619 [Henosepilachna vigintioctopunctata]|uniref:Chitin-binding type-2 domain-containing protein n=1 Tax=Henosepilachna vigintioctopunctata TaxID=420089 RepID=A0AAW1TZN5_9CUCU
MIFELLLVSFIYSAQAFDPCDTVGQLIPDPNSPGFFQCTNWGWQPMPCPTGLCFNPENSVCDWYVAETRCGNHSDVKPCEPLGKLKPDPDDCHSFQQCINTGWVKLQCRGDLYFNPDLLVCVKPGPNDNCGGGNNHHDDDSDLEPCSNPGEIKPDTKHCDLYQECTDCGWSFIQCPAGQLFNPVKLACDKADQVKCAQDGDLQPCDKIGEHKVDPKHCDLYYECTKCGWALVNCEAGLYFNPKTSTCDNPENVNCGGVDPILEPCDNIGQLKPDDEHCDHYFKCTKKGWGSLPCEAGLLFNPKSLECEAAGQVKCGGSNDDPTTAATTTTTTATTTTTTNTATPPPFELCDHVDELKPDPQNCNKFYQCTPYGWQNMPCPGKLVFNPNTNNCDNPENYQCKIADIMS